MVHPDGVDLVEGAGRANAQTGRPKAARRLVVQRPGQMATRSFNPLAALNAGTVAAAIWIVAPVCGLRP